jgi:protein-disulfide isomerase
VSNFWPLLGKFAAGTIAAAGIALNLAATQPARAADEQPKTEPAALTEITYGTADAPVTIVEYASLTCPHCADFHKNTLPKLKEAVFDTGKARLVFRDFPLDQLALRAAVMVRCAPQERQKPLLEALFATQESWARAEDPLEALDRIGRTVGMTDDTLQQCFENQELINAVIQERLEAEKTYEVSSTPSFIIGDKVYRGALTVEEMTEAVESVTP